MITIVIYHQRILLKTAKFNNITELWLAGDHYKWRAMRAHGIDERFITGDAAIKGKICSMGKNSALYTWKSIISLDTFRVKKILWH